MLILPKIRGSSFMLSSRIIPFVRYSFLTARTMSGVVFFISFHQRPSFQKNSSSSHFSYRYPIIPVLRSSVLLARLPLAIQSFRSSEDISGDSSMFQLIRGCHLIQIFQLFRYIIYLFIILFNGVFF